MMTMKEIAKKIIKSINPGNKDISNIGDGTITGAISELNTNITTLNNDLETSDDKINGVITRNAHICSCLQKASGDGRYVYFTFTCNTLRTPILILTSTQNGSSSMHTVKLETDGSGSSNSTGTTVTGGKITVDIGQNSWGQAIVFYNSGACTLK